MRKERRHHFFINQSLQLRYMLTVSAPIFLVTVVSLVSLYFGLWGNILNAFSNEQIRNDLLTASRLQQYEEARLPRPQLHEPLSLLSFVRESERLSERQREVFREILNQANRDLAAKLLALFGLIAAGTIFISHKVAGPLYRFRKTLEEITQGNLTTRCQLRKFDEAKPLARDFNQTLSYLDTSLSEIKRILQENEKNPDLLAARLKEKLSKFKTSH